MRIAHLPPAFFVWILILLQSMQPVSAQNQAQDRVIMDQTLRASTGMSSGTGELTPNKMDDEKSRLLESEFGLQKLRSLTAKPPSLLIGIEAAGFFTSNAVLVPFDERTDWVGRSLLRASWFPEITDHLSLLVSTSYGLWRYSDLSFLDFDDFGGQAGLVWKSSTPLLTGRIPVFSVWLQYRYNRLTQPWEWHTLLYETHFIESGMRRAWGVGERMTIWVGGNAAASVSGEPGLFRRDEYSAQVGALWQMTPKLSLTALYRAARFDYVQGSRQDINHLLFAGIAWQISPLLRADFYASGTRNNSNVSIFDYKVANLGLNVALTKMW